MNGCRSKSTENTIEGRWQGTDSKSNKVCIVLNRDRSAYWIQDNFVIGGELASDSNKLALAYETDTFRIPNTLDFIVYNDNKSQIVKRLPGIFRWLGPNQIELRFSFKGERHKYFAGQNKPVTTFNDPETIILNKVYQQYLLKI